MFLQQRGVELWRDDARHRVVRDPLEFQQAVQWLAQQPVVAVDTETSGLAWHKHARPCGISMAAWKDGAPQCFYFPYRHLTGEQQLPPDLVVQGCRAVLENPTIVKVLHNIKFDEHQFARDGLQIIGPRRDTIIEAHLYDENSSLALKERAARDLGDPRAHEFESILDRAVSRLAKEAHVTKGEFMDRTGYACVPVMLCGVYACWDVDFTLRLAQFYDARGVRQFFSRTYDTEMKLTHVLFQMEEAGLPVNVPYLQWLASETSAEMERLRPELVASLGMQFDPDSDDEVRDLVCNRLGLESKLWKRTKSGDKWSVDAEVLEGLVEDAPGLRTLLAYREASKIRTTYTTSITDRVGRDGNLHGEFKQIGTNTGRMSAEKPNLQNFSGDSDARAIALSGKKLEDGGKDPWSVKRAFINRGPRDRWMRIYHDYSQIELRVLAYYSRDPVMLETYARNEDIHARTSMEVFGTKEKAARRKAKVINFGLSYCMSAKGYARQTKVSEEQGERDMARFFARYGGISPFRESFWNECRQRNPPSFVNMFGRPRRVPLLTSRDKWERLRAERQAIGSLIQGTAAELTKESLVRIWEWEQRNRSGLLLCQTIHDEISYDVPTQNARDVVRAVVPLMESYPQFNPVPILTDTEFSDTDWSEKRHFEEGVVEHVWKFAA